MEVQALKDPLVKPTDKVMASALGRSYEAFSAFMQVISGDEYALVPGWRYYNDGKAWLCKVMYGSKTILWLSVWQGFFKVSFFFTERTGQTIGSLAIDNAIKLHFKQGRPIGKLFPLAMNIRYKKQLKDVFTIIRYKKALK